MTKTMVLPNFLANSGLACNDCFKLVEIMNVINLLIFNRLIKIAIFESEVRNVGWMIDHIASGEGRPRSGHLFSCTGLCNGEEILSAQG